MALFKKNNAEEVLETPVAADANAPEAEAPKAKKEKKNKQQYLEAHKMNFKEQYEIVVEGKKKNVDLAKIMKPLIAVAVVVLAVFILLEVVLLGMKAQTKSLNKYLNDEQNVLTYNEAIATKQEIDTVNIQKANLEACILAIDTYPNVGVDFFNTISKTATKNKVVVNNFGYANETGYLSLSCTGTSLNGISEFVRDMEEVGLFTDVSYSGFSGTAEGGYSFQITCVCLGDQSVTVTAAETAEVAEN